MDNSNAVSEFIKPIVLLILIAGLLNLNTARAEEPPERVPHEYLVKLATLPNLAQSGVSSQTQKRDILKSFSDLGMTVEPVLTRLLVDRDPPTNLASGLSVSPAPAQYFRIRIADSLGLDAQSESQLLLGHPGVLEVTPNYIFHTLQINADPFLSSTGAWGQGYQDLWNLHRIRAPEAWSITEGEGVKVAVVDSGVDYDHPDLQSSIWINPGEIAANGIDDDGNGFIDDVRGFDFTTCDKYGTLGCSQKKERDADPMDLHGHGTHCAGTVAAVRNNGIGVAGVSPKAKIIPIRALNQSGGGELIDLADAVLYAIHIGADIINASWGASGVHSIPIFEEVFEMARQRGVLVVAAAGNENKLVYDIAPGGSQKVFTVGSSDVNDAKSDFSNFSEAPYYNSGYKKTIEIAAPGGGGAVIGMPSGNLGNINILSLRANGTDMYAGAQGYSAGSAMVSDPGTNNRLYYRSAGTSMAAPMVSGAAALVLSYLRTTMSQSGLSAEEYRRQLIDEVRARLITSAKKIPGLSKPDNWIGYGRLDVKAALSDRPSARVIILDDEIEDSSGIVNGIVEGGEEGTLRLLLSKEYGAFNALDGELIAKDSSLVTILKSHADFYFDSGGSSRGIQQSLFTFRAGSVHFQTPIELTLRLSGAGETIEIPMTIYFGARRLSTTALYTKESFFGGFSPLSIPSISNHRIAWADSRYGSSDILLFDFRTRQTVLVSRSNHSSTPHPGIQFNPYLSESQIVWQDDRDGNWDIRIANIDRLGDDQALALGDIASQNQHQPVLQGNNIFFTNEAVPGKINPDLKVMHYDLAAKKLNQLSSQGSQFNPAISESSAVWENTGALGLELVPDTTQIKQRMALLLPLFPFQWPIEPAIDGNRIAYIDGTFGAGRDLFVVEYNSVQSKNVFRQLTNDSAQQWRPQIHRNQVVWADNRSGVWGVRAFDLDKGREFTLSAGTRASGVPNTRDGYVTWIQRGSLWVTQLPGFPSAPVPAPTATPIPNPDSSPVPEVPGASIKIAIKNGAIQPHKNKSSSHKISLITTPGMTFEGVALFVLSPTKKSCPKPLISFATLRGVKRLSIRVPNNLGLRKVMIELRSSTGTVLGRARIDTSPAASRDTSITSYKNHLATLCKSIKASK